MDFNPPLRALPLAGLLVASLATAAIAFQQPKAELRLVDGGVIGGASHAGLDMVLPKDTLTYWRHPGEAGIPPVFDFSGSTNLAEAVPLFPAPSKLDEAGATVFGYAGRVVFPIRLRAADASKPVDLKLDLDYAICERICIPAKASLTARIAAQGAPDPAVAAALASVPAPLAVGAEGPLTILEAKAAPAAGKTLAAWSVTARTPGPAQLFAEPPEGYWVEADDPAPGASPVFGLRLVEAPKARASRIPVRLTLVAGERAIETVLDLDLPPAAP